MSEYVVMFYESGTNNLVSSHLYHYSYSLIEALMPLLTTDQKTEIIGMETNTNLRIDFDDDDMYIVIVKPQKIFHMNLWNVYDPDHEVIYKGLTGIGYK